MTGFLHAANSLLAQGRSCLPLTPGQKSPLYTSLPLDDAGKPQWKEFSHRLPTPAEIVQWSKDSNDRANIGMCMGSVSKRIGIDVDFRNGGYESWKELFGDERIAAETVASGDGFHCIFVYPGHEVRFKEKLPGIDLRSSGSYLVRPPSKHPSGAIYQMIMDGISADIPLQIWENLEVDVTHSMQRQLDLSITTQDCLAILKRIALRHEEFTSRSEFDYGVLSACGNRGADFKPVLAAFDSSPYPTRYGHLKSRYGADRAHKYLYRSYLKALQQPDGATIQLIAHQAQFLRDAVSSRVWTGIQGRTEQKVLLAHLDRYGQNKHEPWHLDTRSAEEMSRISRSAVSGANRRLISQEWLESMTSPTPGKYSTSTFRLGSRLLDILHNHKTPLYNVCTCPGAQLLEDYGVFENIDGGLGIAAEKIWHVIAEGPKRQVDIVSETALHKSTVSRQVLILERYGLITKSGRTYEAVTGFDFEALGDELGTSKINEVRKQVNSYQRSDFHPRVSGLSF